MTATLQDYTGGMPGFSNLKSQQPPPPQKLLHQSIWQVAAQPIFPSQSPPSDDQRWQMFRSLYMGVKQTALALYLEDRSKTGGNCPYWKDKHAHVKRPYTFSSILSSKRGDAQGRGAQQRIRLLCEPV